MRIRSRSRSALYELSRAAEKRHIYYTAEAIAAILKEAAEKRVSNARAYAIAMDIYYSSQPDTVEEVEAEIKAETEAAAEAEKREAEEQAEAEAILDGPPPELPPPESAPLVDFLLPAFDQAISKLKELSTKHSDKFSNSAHSAADIEVIAEFLSGVARIKAKKAA